MTHLTKRNGVYYFRRKIPLELQPLYGRAEIVFSLKTKTRSEAEPLARKCGVEYDKEFAEARAKALEATIADNPNPSPSESITKKPSLADGLTVADVDVLVSRYVQRFRERREAAAGDQKTFQQFLTSLRTILEEGEEYLQLGEHPLSADRRPLWQVEASVKAADAVLNNKTLALNLPVTDTARALKPQPALTHLETVLSSWAKERTPDPRSVTQYRRVLRLFIEATGIEHVELVTKAHVVKYKDKLLELGTTTPTTNNYLTNLTTLLEFSVGNALIETNPAKGIRVQVREADKTPREPFTVEHLNRLFSSPIYSGGTRPRGGAGEAAYWLPLLGLFTGARLNELCQMLKTDIKLETYHDAEQHQQECWVFDLTDEGENQKLKNTVSKRRFPVHPVLIELGFVEFVQSSPGPLVFHELKPAKAFGSISANWSKWFSRYLKQIGLKQDSLVFHSFRHSFKYYARQNSIPDNLQYAIQGHSSGNVGDDYGGKVYPLAPLVQAMTTYRIPNLILPPKRH